MSDFTIDKKVFGQRLSELLTETGETVYTLGDKLSLSPSTISRYTNGTMAPKITTLFVMAGLLGVQPLWLMGYDVDKRYPRSDDYKHNVNLTDKEAKLLIAYRSTAPSVRDKIQPGRGYSFDEYAPTYRAPVYDRISAGNPLLVNDNAIGFEYIDRKDDADYFILRVSGDSMNAARINDGDQIIVRQQDDVDDGDIAVVLVNGNDATVKRIRRQNNTVMLIPMSTNPEHQVQIYGPDVPIRILGKVVEVKFKV
ncbi:MAG: XRE family transcriptional regulator [Eubacteriales bacterium]|nr:XRE family transcriptional regulator [Eubacteriales bacterium]